MAKAKKTLSLVMIAIFTTFIVLSGIPASAVTKTAATKQIKSATALVVKAEAAVKVKNFNVTTAQKAEQTAVKQVNVIKTYGKTYTKTYTALAKRITAIQKKINAQKAALAKKAKPVVIPSASTVAAKNLADAQTAVSKAEDLTNTDTYDLVGSDTDLQNAQDAVTNALEAVVKLDNNSADYKGLMARIDAANEKIVKAMEDRDAAAAAIQAQKDEADAVAAAETAVKAVETAPLATAADLAAALDLGKTAADAVSKVTEPDKAADFTARLKKVADAGTALQAALDKQAADAKKAADDAAAMVPANIVSVSAVDGTITVTFNKKPVTTPVLTDLTVTKAVNGTTPAAVTPTNLAVTNDTTVTLTVPAVAATTAAQSVVYTIGYTTGAAVSAVAYTVPAKTVGITSITATNQTNSTIVTNLTEGAFVPANAEFDINVNGVLDTNTVNAATVIITQDGAPIARTISVNDDKNKITVTPSVAMDSTKSYKLTISGVKTTDPLTLADVNVNFKAAADMVVTSIGYSDNGGAETAFASSAVLNSDTLNGGIALQTGGNDSLIFTMNKAVDAGTVSASTIKLQLIGGDYIAPASVTYNATTNKVSFNLLNTTKLADGQYEFSANGVKALDGSSLTTVKYDFYYASAAVTYTNQGVLAAGTTNVYPKLQGGLFEGTYYQGFAAQFTSNKQLDATTVNGTNVKLYKIVNGVSTVVPSTVAFAGGMITVTPSADLDENTSYKVTLDGVKDSTGLYLTATDKTFTTGIFNPVTITNVTPAQGAVVTKANAKVTLTFSKPVNNTAVVFGNAADWTTNATIIMYNSANTTQKINLNAATVVKTWNSDKTQLTLDCSNDVVSGTTYLIKVAGNVSGGSGAPLAASTGTITKLAADYVYTLQVAADTTAPAPVKYLSGSAFSSASDITTSPSCVDETANLYVQFNKVLANAISADNTLDTNIDGNAVLEQYNPTTGAWYQIAISAGALALANTSDGSASYVTIDNAYIPNNAKLRLRFLIQDKNGNKTITDASSNYMTQDYAFVFTTGAGPALATTNEALGGALTADSAAGTTTLTDAAHGFNATSVGKPLTVKLDDGSWFTTTIASIPTVNTISVTNPLPVKADNAAVYFVGANVGSYGTSFDVNQPIVVKLTGADPAAVALNADGGLVNGQGTLQVTNANYALIGSPVAGDRILVYSNTVAPAVYSIASVAVGATTTITLSNSGTMAGILTADAARVTKYAVAVDTNTIANNVKLQTFAGVSVAATTTVYAQNDDAYVVIKPAAKLSAGTSYQVVAGSYADLLGNAASSSTMTFTTGSDYASPKVLTKTPATGTPNVALDADTVVTFDQPLSVIKATVPANGNGTAGGTITITDANYAAIGSPIVGNSVSVKDNDTTAVTYAITAVGSAAGITTLTLGAHDLSTFTTAQSAIVYADVTAALKSVAGLSVNTNSVASLPIALYDNTNTAIPATATLSADGKKLTVSPANPMPGSAVVTLALSTTLGNSAGTLADNYSSVTVAFQTEAGTAFPAAYVGHSDVTTFATLNTDYIDSTSAPYAVADNAHDLYVKFSKNNINTSNATATLTDVNTGVAFAVAGLSTLANAGAYNIVDVNPLLSLVNDAVGGTGAHTYKLVLTGLVDGDGVTIPAVTVYFQAH